MPDIRNRISAVGNKIPGFFTIIIFTFLVSGPWSGVRAAETADVPAAYTLSYDVDEKGTTTVAIKISLYNPNQNVYISGYSLFINEVNPRRLQARDGLGRLSPQLSQRPDGTEIDFKFNQKVVGTQKPLELFLNYESGGVARKNGRVWEITLPKASPENNLRDFDVSLNVPNSFGPEIFISPLPSLVEKRLTRTLYKFTNKSLARTGAILSFGADQIYGFHLKYHLKNNNLWPAKTKIALPPSLLNEQLIVVDQISPQPQKMETDTDGNYLATYQLTGGQSLVVELKGRVKVYNASREVNLSGTFSEIPPSLKKLYLGSQKYWEVNDPQIKGIVKETVGSLTPDSKVDAVAKKLFEKTVALLDYDPGRVKPDLRRFGALESLAKPTQAVCMEFADLFLTLLRAAGIPAQLLEGYASPSESGSRPAIGDVLHTWVRLYLPKVGWVAVDPTWADTTGGLDYFSHWDTNHFIFVIKGLNAEYPYPAGAYKISPDQVDDIRVEVLPQNEDFDEPQSFLSYKFNQIGWGSLFSKTSWELVLKNEGKTTLFSPKLNLVGSSFNLADLPPLGDFTHQFKIEKEPAPDQSLGRISWINSKNEVENKEIIFPKKDVKTRLNQITNSVSIPFFKFLIILSLCCLLGYFLIVRATPRP